MHLAKRPRAPRSPFPALGSAFGVALEDGRWGICRVIAIDPRGRGGWVAATEWVGTEAELRLPSTLNDARTLAVLRRTHHAWQGEPEVGFHSEPPPPGLVFIGIVAPQPNDPTYVRPVPEDLFERGMIFGNWAYGHQMLLEWRWRNERAAVDAEDAATKAANDAALAKLKNEQEKPRISTLAALRRERFFASWRPDQPNEVILAARAIVHAAIDELRRDKAAVARAGEILRQAVTRLNQLDAARDHFVATIEREDIDAALFSVAQTCGLNEAEYERSVSAHFDF